MDVREMLESKYQLPQEDILNGRDRQVLVETNKVGIVNKKPTNKEEIADRDTNHILDEIAIKYGTDKSPLWHNYTRHYLRYFSPLREKRLKVLEIGVAQGQSLKMWEEFFPNAEIFGIDTNSDCLKSANERVKVFIGDQADEKFLKSFAEKAGGNFDIIIDDGGHFMHQQITSFRILFPCLNAGGIYVIEDLCTSYWENFGGGFRKSYTTVEFLKDLIDELNNRGKQGCGDPAKISYSLQENELNYFTTYLDSIHFYLSICFIFKRDSHQIIRSLDGRPQVQVETAVRCSIILPAGNDSAKLSAYLHQLGEMRLSSDFETVIVNNKGLEIDKGQIKKILPALKVLNAETVSTQKELFDKGAMNSSGEYLLLVRDFIKFDKSALDESINELAGSGEKLSISANKNFVLMENPFYPAKNDLGNNGERVDIFYKEGIRFDGLDINQKNHCRRYEYAKSIIPAGKIVGDFACGTGYGSVMLSRNSARVIGADINEEVIKQIKVRYKNIRNVEFVHANLLDLEYQSLFDYIVSFETIEHLKEGDASKLFGVFRRALKPGGTLILSTPYMEQKTPQAINRGFHSTFQINEAKIQQWLSANSLVCEFFKYQNYHEHNVEDQLEKKDFIICVARSYGNDSPKQQIPKEAVPTQSFSADKKSLASNKAEKPHQPKTASIVIPVFNNVEYTKQCLRALIENTPNSPYEVVIVDNGSTDGTKEFLKCLGGSLKIISNAENLGFARACNQGSAVAGGDYLVFLNNDTKVQPGWLEELTKVLQNDSDVAAVGSKLLYPDGSIQHAGVAVLQVEGKNSLLPKHVFMQQPSDHIFVNVPMLFQVVTAACIVIRKSDFHSVNGFDQGYWNGYEDVDLCFKLTETGKKIVYQPKSVVLHYESRSSKEERYKGIQQNDRLLQERWAGKIRPDIIISGNQVRQGPSQAIQTYLQNDESVSVSRSEYINALTCWVQKSIVEPIRSPVKKFRFAIKTCTPTRNDLGWGDTPFANSLAKAITKLGNSCEVQFKNEWNQADKHIDIVIHLRGLYPYTPKPYNRNILWIINHPERQTIEQINQFDLVFCASRIYLKRLRNTTKVPCFYLPQATDQEVFNPSTSCLAKDIDLLFVGNRYYKDKRRKIIQDVLDTGKKYSLYVIGQGWHGSLDNEYYKAEYVEWHKLPQLYSRAKIVLNDHHETMSQFGFVNNRTFDLAALKAFQISNYVQGIEEFGIVTYKSPQDLARKLDYFLQNETARKEFANLSNKLCQGHTFTNAARRIVDVASKLLNEKNSTKDIQKWCAENAAIDSVQMTDVRIVPRLVLEPMETSRQMQDK